MKITVGTNNFNLLKNVDLEEYFITSKASIMKSEKKEDDLDIKVFKAQGTKCPRCWKILENKCTRCEKVEAD